MERTIELTIGTRFGDMHVDLPVDKLPEPYRSAREMLETLKRLCDSYDTFAGKPFHNPPDSPWSVARAAIARATGTEG